MLRVGMLAISILLLLVLAYSSIFLPPPPQVFSASDKWLHLVVYGGIALIFALQFPRFIGWVLLGCVAYGLMLEGLQGYTFDRQPSLGDGLANAIGSLLGVAAAYLLFLMKRRQATTG